MKTQPEIVELVDQLLDDHIYSEIADILNERGFRPGGSARPGRAADRFTAKHVAYLMHTYGLRSRYDRLRERGMLTKEEAAARLGIHESTLVRWAEYGIVKRHAYNAHAYLYELPDESAGQTLQSMGPARRSSSGPQNREGIKTLASNRRRCSVKTVSSQTSTTRRRRTTAL